MEKWKRIKDYPDYEISTFGRVKSFKRKQSIIMIGKINKKGYHEVTLMNGHQKSKQVHQLVAIAFLNHTPQPYILAVDHINFDRLDNKLENLRVISQRENTNQKHFKNKTSRYIGVHWNKEHKKWTASIWINRKTKFLGRYRTEKVASAVYQYELEQIEKPKLMG